MKHYIIYHNKDLDGFCSGAIVKKHLLLMSFKEEDIIMVGYNYGDGIVLDKNGVDLENDIVYIVDLSLEDVEMKALDRDNCIWIDHHKSAIDKAETGAWPDLSGVRKIGDSASLLAWKFFFETTPVPDIVYYVDRYDVFKKDDGTKIPWDTVRAAQEGMKLIMRDPLEIYAYKEWSFFMDQRIMSQCIKDGKIILSYLRKQNQDVARKAFPIGYGDKTFAAINFDRPDIEISEFVRFKHDGVLFFTCYSDSVTISMRKNEKHQGDILGLAKQFGGGGHERACGCSLNYSDFASLIK